MICTKCGANLTAGANFCPTCGTRVMPPSGSAKAAGVQECSEKNQLMVRAPGKGLYFIANEERLYFYNEATKKTKALTKASSSVSLCGLGYSGGKLYFWHECRDERSKLYGMRLYEMDPDTGAARTVWESDEEQFEYFRLDNTPYKARAILYEGSYFLLNHYDQTLMRISLPDGARTDLPLPDMRGKMPPYDWIKPRGPVNPKSEKPNFGLEFTGLAIVEGRVYLSVDEYAVCTLRFPLYHPEKIAYMHANACTATADGAAGGMLAGLNGRVYSCPGTVTGATEISICEISPDENLLKLVTNTTGGVVLLNKAGRWWRMGNTLYIGQVALSVSETQRKWHKLPLALFDADKHKDGVFGEVRDFVPAKDGVYLLTENSVYLVPPDWESKMTQARDRDQFRLLRLKSL